MQGPACSGGHGGEPTNLVNFVLSLAAAQLPEFLSLLLAYFSVFFGDSRNYPEIFKTILFLLKSVKVFCCLQLRTPIDTVLFSVPPRKGKTYLCLVSHLDFNHLQGA